MKLRILLLAIVCAVAAGTAHAATPVTGSPIDTNTVSANGSSFTATFSPDGQKLFFLSHAGNLTSNQPLGESLQLFVRDLVASNTVRVNVLSNRVPADADVTTFSLSSNGQFIAFASEANDWSLGDTNLGTDVFVHDLANKTNRLVSAHYNGRPVPMQGFFGNLRPIAFNPLISADGRWVYFESDLREMMHFDIDQNGGTDVFRRDMQLMRTELVSRASPWFYMAADQPSKLAAITPDGQRVAFLSRATDLVAEPSSGQEHVYLRDMISSNTVRVSIELNNFSTPSFGHVDLSDDGRFIFFAAQESGFPAALYIRDLEAPAPVLVATNDWVQALSVQTTPQLSAEGRYVLFQMGTNLFRFDRITGTNELVTVATMGVPFSPNIGARDANMTPDGNGIVFNSNLADLTTNNAVGWHLYARDMAAGTTRLITVATNGQPSTGQRTPLQFSVSPDFSRVAFSSTASDLVVGDNNRASDVFLHDLGSGETELVSRRAPERSRLTGSGHAFISSDCISADGRYVAFTSYDNDLMAGDTNVRPDVFIRDLATGELTTPGLSTNAARFPASSANGRYLAYLRRNPSSSSDQSGSVFRFDRETGVETLVQAAAQSPPAPPPPPAINADGNLVAFHSNAMLVLRDMAAGTNEVIAPAVHTRHIAAVFTPDSRFLLFNSTALLTTNATGSETLYAWDRSDRSVQLLASRSGIFSASVRFCVSANSRFVATVDSLGLLEFHDLMAGTSEYIQYNARDVGLNRDGTLMSFVETAAPWRLVLTNRVTGSRRVIDTGFHLSGLMLSPDGRFLVYGKSTIQGDSHLANFAAEQAYVRRDLYVRDLLLGTTTHLTPVLFTAADGQPNPAVLSAQMSGDGRTVVFHSAFNQLVPHDFNDKLDVFSIALARDIDDDGLDDDWEVAYFGNLSRDGSGDYDMDGASDRDEFLATTDPTNGGSVFRVVALIPVSGGSVQVIWEGNPALAYRVEYKNDLNVPNWTTLSGTISWNGSTASIIDTSAGTSPNRFYRAVRLP